MRVHFDVHGTTQTELEQEAERILEGFADHKPAYITISAEPEVSAQDGTVLNWRGEVEAQV